MIASFFKSVSKGRWIYVAVIVVGCLGWKLFGTATWQAALSLMLFCICIPIVLDAFVRRSD